MNLPNQQLNGGWRLLQAGQAQSAALLAQQQVLVDADNAEAWCLLASAQQMLGRLPEAIDSFRRAVALQPGVAELHNDLGVALAEAKNVEEAVPCWEEALRLRPDYAVPYNNWGRAVLEQGRYAEAVALFHKAIGLQADSAEAHNNLGIAYQQLNQLAEAVAAYREAVRLRPNYVEGLNNLSGAVARQGNVDEGIQLLNQALNIVPNHPGLHANLALMLGEKDRLEEAALALEKAVALQPELAFHHFNLANVRHALGRLEEAVASFDRALALDPSMTVARWNRCWVCLLQGDFRQGWRDYELRWDMLHIARYGGTAWDTLSRPGQGTVLLHCEQGRGDMIQFCRYASLVKERAGRVILRAPGRMIPLLRSCAGIDLLVDEEQPLPEFDTQVPLMTLPFVLGTTIESIPAQVPYLSASVDLVEKWRQKLGETKRLRIGIAWRGNKSNNLEPRRGIPLQAFAGLAQLRGVELISLQKGYGEEELNQVDFPVTRLGDDVDRDAGAFMDTAAVMQHLDLVISSDCVIAHLAGALARPVWTLLWHVPEWRWLMHRSDSPWYPTMRLFRQSHRGDWAEVFQRVVAEVRKLRSTGGSASARRIPVPLAPAELVDRISILEVRLQRVADPVQLQATLTELSNLTAVSEEHLGAPAELTALAHELRQINTTLWDAEDALRACEQSQDFGPGFIELARAIARSNDERAALKRRINELVGRGPYIDKIYSAATPSPSNRTVAAVNCG